MGDEGQGPASAGVAHINRHGKEQFGGVLSCSWTPNKGRIVRAARTFAPGDVILVESPLHIVQKATSAAYKKVESLCKEREDSFDYEALWYWCAIQSLTNDQLEGARCEGCTGASPETQHNLLLLHHEEVREPSAAAKILAQDLVPNADMIIIERLIQVWVLNCFEYSDEPEGYSTYFFSSFMSHSCYPNAVWHYDGADHVLRCRREIAVGDEVCISYLPESGLLQSAPARRMELNETKRFWCDCERCAPGVDDLSRGLRCPACADGRIFARTPDAGPARDATLLASQIAGARCSSCDRNVTKTEATKLAAHEAKLKEIVDAYGRPDAKSVKQLEVDEGFVDQHFSQHVLADLAWEQFCSHYAAKRRVSDQRRLLERRVDFLKTAYPGLSGAHAWALEALGDCLRSGPPKPTTEELQRDDGSRKRQWAAALAADTEDAKFLYGEAVAVLRLMFGEGHEHVTEVQTKLDALNAAQKK